MSRARLPLNEFTVLEPSRLDQALPLAMTILNVSDPSFETDLGRPWCSLGLGVHMAAQASHEHWPSTAGGHIFLW